MNDVPEPNLGFIHSFKTAADAGAPILLLSHGTGGDENDLLPLGRSLAPSAGLLSPRGQVLEHGMPRFFRTLAEGVFDLDDLRRRTFELAEFVSRAAERYRFDRNRVVAVGFSNGANMAASLLLLRPDVLGGAVLFRATVPLAPDPLPTLRGSPVLLSNGRNDPFISPVETERLAAMLRRAGADITLEWQQAGHNLTPEDVSVPRKWLALRDRSSSPVPLSAD